MSALRHCVITIAVFGLIACTRVEPAGPTWSEIVRESHAAHPLVVSEDPTLVYVDFSFTPDTPAEIVHLTGEFAAWSSTGIPMSDEDGDGTWTVSHGLEPGRYLYKFVINGSDWRHDPNNPERADDGHQGFNSILNVSFEGDRVVPEASRDGQVEADYLYHDPSSAHSLRLASDNVIEVTLRTLRGDAESVSLLCGSMGTPTEIPMDFVWDTDRYDHYRAAVAIDEVDLWGYLFVVRDGADEVQFGPEGTARPPIRRARMQTAGAHAWTPPFTVRPSDLVSRQIPDWAMDAVWYQIFPERFRNGDTSNDEDLALPWTWDWPEYYTEHERENFYRRVFERRFGGDIQGIIDELPYLQDLGVTAIYLNPVFEAESLHKYETSDYRHIDDNFGTRGDLDSIDEELDPSTWVFTPSDRLFLELIHQAHARGIRVIIDGVFNHTGRHHFAFQDVLANGRDSQFADWYKINSWDPFEYSGWAGEQDLPEFAQNEDGLVPGVRDHLFDVTRRWMDPNGDGNPSDGIDGWRLDVPNLISKPFWRDWCALVREINPDSYIVGELWGRNPDWVEPDLFDAHMNYEWLRGVFRFFINDDPSGAPVYTPSEFNRYLFDMRDSYDSSTNYVMQNLLDSHDTDRIASAIMNPNRPVDGSNRIQDGADYDQSKPTPEAYRRLRLIQMFQFTSIGAPMVWYGDEVGMWGADDPHCRKPMLWDDLVPYDNPLVNIPDEGERLWVTTLGQLRAELTALRRGFMRPLLLDDEHNVYGFERRLYPQPSDDDVAVVLNRSDETVTVELPVHWPDGAQVENVFMQRLNELSGITANMPAPLTVENGHVTLALRADEGAILVRSE